MLRGRESLVRMVGKRRTIDSPDQTLSEILAFISSGASLHSSTHSLPVSPANAEGDFELHDLAPPSSNVTKELSLGFCSSDAAVNKQDLQKDFTSEEIVWVLCPVCEKRTQETQINQHLDACLTRGSKRKLTQCTLLKFNIGIPSSKEEIDESLTNCTVDQEHKCKKHSSDPIAQALSNGLCDTRESNSNDTSKIFLSCDGNIQHTCMVSMNENEYSSYSYNDEIMKNGNICNEKGSMGLGDHRTDDLLGYSNSKDTMQTKVIMNRTTVSYGDRPHDADFDKFENKASLGTLDTYIVGRKFNLQTKAIQGASVSFVRDADNLKDKNAIKVMYLSSKSETQLGHLPRELALYLCPLLDRNLLEIEGTITSVSAIDSAAVPISLHCRKTVFCGKEDPEREIFLKSNWGRAVHVVKLMNNFPLDVPKYQRNFRYVIQTTLEQHAHLFTCEEKAFLESFQSLSGDSQRLFIRLYQRKGPWFRVTQLSYTDISDIESACQELLASGFLHSLESEIGRTGVITKEMLGVLTVPELKQLATSIAIKRREISLARREELVELLLSSSASGREERYFLDSSNKPRTPILSSVFRNVAGFCVEVSQLAGNVLWKVQRLFFLNGEQDLSTFLLVDIGLVKYPDYNCQRSQRIFETASDFLSYEKALLVAQIMDMAIETNDMSKVAKCTEIACLFLINSKDNRVPSALKSDHIYLLPFSAAWVYTKILTLRVSVLEREQRYEEAIKLLWNLLSGCYCPGRRGYWTLRLSIDLEHIGHTEESLQAAEKGVNDPWVRSGEKMALQRRILRLGKPPRRWKKPVFSNIVQRKIKEVHLRGRPLNSALGARSIFYGYDDQQCGVEQLALQYYAGVDGGCWQGVHSEGSIWLTYYGLLMWDVLFADVSDVFVTPFQSAPLDLGTDSFYLSRQSLIEEQLSKIETGKIEDMLADSWQEHYGTSCHGVKWERYSLEELQTIGSCVGGRALAAVCKLLSEDYRSWSSGMPDLLLWRTRKYEEGQRCNDGFEVHNYGEDINFKGEAKLVEVKGPRDRLSEQQRAWILVLMDAGLNVEVCKIGEMQKEIE